VYISPRWRAKTPGRIELKFSLVVGVHDLIPPFKFGDDRFRGFWLAEGQILPFPIYFEGRSHNTHYRVRCDTASYWLKIAIFFNSLLFSVFVPGYPFWIYRKALRFLKLESSRQPTMKIW